MLKFAYLGAWHSHASMHTRESTERPEEFKPVGFYDPDPEGRCAERGGVVRILS